MKRLLIEYVTAVLSYGYNKQCMYWFYLYETEEGLYYEAYIQKDRGEEPVLSIAGMAPGDALRTWRSRFEKNKTEYYDNYLMKHSI